MLDYKLYYTDTIAILLSFVKIWRTGESFEHLANELMKV